MKIISTYNQKGGVGKTTLAWLLGEALTYNTHESKVLLIDNDEQRNLTETILIDPSRSFGTLSDLDFVNDNNVLQCYNGEPLEQNLITTPFENLHLLPGSDRIKSLSVKPDALLKILDPFINGNRKGFYDYVIIDNGPANDQLTAASIRASDMVLVPFATDNYSFSACIEVEKYLEREFPEKEMKIVTTMLKNTKSSLVYLNAARKIFHKKILNTEIPSGSDVENAKLKGRSLFLYKEGAGKISQAYINLLIELFGRDDSEIFESINDERRKVRADRARQTYHDRVERMKKEGAK